MVLYKYYSCPPKRKFSRILRLELDSKKLKMAHEKVQVAGLLCFGRVRWKVR